MRVFLLAGLALSIALFGLPGCLGSSDAGGDADFCGALLTACHQDCRTYLCVENESHDDCQCGDVDASQAAADRVVDTCRVGGTSVSGAQHTLCCQDTVDRSQCACTSY